NRALCVLLGEMGVLDGQDRDGEPVVAEQFLCREPEERVFYKGRWYEGLYMHAGASDEDRAQLDAFNAEVSRWVDWRDSRGRRAFAIPINNSSNDAEATDLDRVSMAEWLNRRGLNSPRLRWWVDYACRDDYGIKAEDTSAWAGLFYFASRVPKGGQESQPLITWPEGNGRLASYLAQQVRDKIRVGLAAVDINPTEGGVDVAALDYDGISAAGFHAGHLVFAAPHFLTRYVIRPFRENPPAGLGEFHYSAWMVANLFLKNRPRTPGVPLAWDNVLYESESLGYVVATHQRGLDFGPTVFTYYYPLCDADDRAARARLLEMGRDEWADVIMTDLRRAHPDIDSLVERIDVMRWGHGMIRPRTGFIWSDARTKAAEPYRGVHFAHSDLSGVAIFEEAFYQGIRAAEEVLAAKGRLDRRLGI
ncbi:MAG TPA: FAD-dependent oxidoreductase, partial [Blastocatellia bacterium]|nr:FAD-dependent oxidoreductase [Blastocatellia bacterium]